MAHFSPTSALPSHCTDWYGLFVMLDLELNCTHGQKPLTAVFERKF